MHYIALTQNTVLWVCLVINCFYWAQEQFWCGSTIRCILSFTAKWIQLLLHIWDIWVTNLGSEVSCLDWGFLWLSLVLPRECLDGDSKYIMAASFHVSFKPSLVNHSAVPLYICRQLRMCHKIHRQVNLMRYII